MYSCTQKSKIGNKNPKIQQQDSVLEKPKTETSQTETSTKILVGVKIEGDFDGDGKTEFAIVTKTKEGEGNPIEDGTPDEYTISFSNKVLKPIIIGCCESKLINEGDLNDDGKDEFTVFQAPMNGCTYSMTTYSFENSNWKQIIETFSIPTGCETLTNEELQNRIFVENKVVYKYERDPNDEDLKLLKKKVEIK